MMRILATEDFPKAAVDALRLHGHDVQWVRTESPGIGDREVLAQAQLEKRIVITLDKDFGKLAFRYGLSAQCGVIIFRIAPAWAGSFLLAMRRKRLVSKS